jgi:hypothetical protein
MSQQAMLNVQSSIRADSREIIDELKTRKGGRFPAETPILLDSTVTVKDDAQCTLDWTFRRLWRQVNADPEDYWRSGTYPEEVTPNLKETVFWEHLMPMTLNPKVRKY